MQTLLNAWAAVFADPRQVLFRMALWLLVYGLICRALELWRPRRPAPLLRPHFGQDLAYHLLAGLVPPLLVVAGSLLVVGLLRGVAPLSLHQAVAGWPVGLRVLAGLVVGDFAYYWAHRWQHEWPALWRLHLVHHSATHLDWLVNTRAHPVDLAFSRVVAFIPTFYFGFAGSSALQGSLVVTAVTLLTGLQAYVVHANISLRASWLEPWVVTPVFHHWHHSNDGPATNNKNFGGVFPWWDRLFGTYQAPAGKESEEGEEGGFPRRYGSESPLPEGLLGQLFMPLPRAPGGQASPPPQASERPAP